MNQKWVNGFTGNILNGVPRNIYPEYGMGVEGIETKLVDNNSFLTKMFPYTARCIPIGYIHWLLIGVALFALLRLDFRRLTVLAPALGLMATLILNFANILLAALWTCPTITVTIIYSNDISTRRRTPKWTKLQF